MFITFGSHAISVEDIVAINEMSVSEKRSRGYLDGVVITVKGNHKHYCKCSLAEVIKKLNAAGLVVTPTAGG